jgi:hypothetical protein
VPPEKALSKLQLPCVISWVLVLAGVVLLLSLLQDVSKKLQDLFFHTKWIKTTK